MSLAPRPVVLLLCCVALARVGALGNRKEGEAAEASADAVSQNVAWPSGLLGRLGGRFTERPGPSLFRGGLCGRPISFRASEDSKERHSCPATAPAAMEVSEKYP